MKNSAPGQDAAAPPKKLALRVPAPVATRSPRPSSAGEMALDSVLEACLYVDDLEAAETFYADVLGLTLHSKLEGRHVFFRCGAQMVLLFNPEATADPDLTPRGLGLHGAHGPGHLAFGVTEDEIDLWRARLENRGVPIEQEVDWGGDRGRSIYFRDPDGNSLEFATPALWGLDR